MQELARVTVTVFDDHSISASTSKSAVADAKTWLSAYCRFDPLFAAEDNLGTTFMSCAAMILVVSFTQNDDYRLLAEVIGLPAKFTRLTVELARRFAFYSCEPFLELKRITQTTPTELKMIRESMRCALELYWDRIYTPETIALLDAFRNGELCGGEIQTWDFECAEDDFGLFDLTPEL